MSTHIALFRRRNILIREQTQGMVTESLIVIWSFNNVWRETFLNNQKIYCNPELNLGLYPPAHI
jgi:hypothetical protein